MTGKRLTKKEKRVRNSLIVFAISILFGMIVTSLYGYTAGVSTICLYILMDQYARDYRWTNG